jgi:hypothetical protein
VAQAPSPEAALAEVQSYTSMYLNVDQITGLRDILAIKRQDTAIHRHLKKHGHPLKDLQRRRLQALLTAEVLCGMPEI